jgi:hypothetical protein
MNVTKPAGNEVDEPRHLLRGDETAAAEEWARKRSVLARWGLNRRLSPSLSTRHLRARSERTSMGCTAGIVLLRSASHRRSRLKIFGPNGRPGSSPGGATT